MTHHPLTLGQRLRINQGSMVPCFRHMDRAPSDPFPFASHRALSEVWGLTPDQTSAASDAAMLERNAG
jgi:hypothetical protein